MSQDNNNSNKKFEEALQLLNEAAKEKKDEIQNLLGDKYTDIRKIIEQAAGKQQKNIQRAQRVAGEWIEENEEKFREVVSDVDESVHENPWPYIGGVAVGALLLGFILDLLQEINNRIRSESSRMWNKVTDVAYDATVGLFNLYRQKAIQLVKISAASAYLQLLKAARKHAILIFLAIFAVVLLAVAVVVIPVALVMVAPWSAGVKAIELAALGLLDIGTVLFCLQNVFSEEKWMKASGFNELLDSIDSEEK